METIVDKVLRLRKELEEAERELIWYNKLSVGQRVSLSLVRTNDGGNCGSCVDFGNFKLLLKPVYPDIVTVERAVGVMRDEIAAAVDSERAKLVGK